MWASTLCAAQRDRGGAGWLSPALGTASRLVGAGLTAAMGLIHLRLWVDGYREIPTIGTLFFLNAMCSGALVIALLTVPVRLRRLTAIATALFTLSTLVGLILSLTVGLFGVHENLHTPLVQPTLIVESVGVLVLLLSAAPHDCGRRHQ